MKSQNSCDGEGRDGAKEFAMRPRLIRTCVTRPQIDRSKEGSVLCDNKCFHFFLDFFGLLWTVQQVLRARGNLGSAICCRKFRHCSWPEALVIHIFLFTTLKLFLLLFAFFFLQLLSTVFTISCSLRLTNPGRLVIRFSVKTSV